MFGAIIGALEAGSTAATVAQGLSSALFVAGTAGNIIQSKHAQEALEEYADTKRAMRAVESKRQRSEMLRQRRIKQAQIENQAAQTGTTGSSGAVGAVQSVGTQTMSNLAFLQQTGNLANVASQANRRAAGYQSRANTAGAFAKLGMQFGDFAALDRLNASLGV